MSKLISCGIVGAGSIGGLIDSPKSSNIASHAHAISKHQNCYLTAICEPNKNNEVEFKKRWGEIKSYSSLEPLLENESVELLIIASPTKQHSQDILKALYIHTLEMILCEKPLVASYEELVSLKEALLQSDKKILINLTRRYDPSFIKIANDIASNKWGKTLHFQATFTKGLLHNGIHMLGVLEHFFGETISIKTLDAECFDGDISGNFALELKDAKGVVSSMRDVSYSTFELTIWFENSKIEIRDGGTKIDIYTKKPSAKHEGYFVLEHQESLKNSLNFYALNSLDFLLQTDKTRCRAILKEHIALHEKIFKIIKKESKK